MKKKIYAALAFALYATTFHAQQIYELSAPAKEKTIYIWDTSRWGAVTRRVEIFP